MMENPQLASGPKKRAERGPAVVDMVYFASLTAWFKHNRALL